MSALTEQERDALHDVWSEDTTVSAASFFPVVARIVASHENAAREEITQAIEALAEEWEARAVARRDTGPDSAAHAASELRALLTPRTER